MHELRDEREMFGRNCREGVARRFEECPEVDDFCECESGRSGDGAGGRCHRPCMVSDRPSNEMGFCLKVTLPFLSSATAAAALCLSGFAVGKGGASWHAGRRCGGDGVPGFIAALSGVAARGGRHEYMTRVAHAPWFKSELRRLMKREKARRAVTARDTSRFSSDEY